MHHPLKDANIDVRLNVDYFKVKDRLPKHKLLIFTGPIDAFYADQGWQKLEYRSIFFEVKLESYMVFDPTLSKERKFLASINFIFLIKILRFFFEKGRSFKAVF